MLRFPIKPRPRKFKGTFGQGSGPAEREKRLQMLVTALVRHERIEGRDDRLDETRQYAEQLINLAIIHGDKHKPTMELADHWLLEKDLVHKLFKVLVPRYKLYETTFTSVYKLPRKYPGPGWDSVILELKGNPYPPVIYQHRNNENLLSNQLIKNVKEHFKKEKTAAAENYSSEEHLKKVDSAVNQLSNQENTETGNKTVENTGSS